VRDDVFCCATKACCSKFRVGNQGAPTCWDSDGPNGPNTVPNSETVLIDWWTTGDNWCVYRGEKNISGKTTTMKKEQTWKMLSERIAKTGITVSRNAKSVGAKISRMEGEYKKAFDFVNNTGQGLMEDGQDITDIMKKMCPYFYELDPIMGSRASTRPMGLFESEGDATEMGEAGDLDDLLAQSDTVSISSNTITSNLRHAGDGSGTDDVEDVNEAAGARK